MALLQKCSQKVIVYLEGLLLHFSYVCIICLFFIIKVAIFYVRQIFQNTSPIRLEQPTN